MNFTMNTIDYLATMGFLLSTTNASHRSNAFAAKCKHPDDLQIMEISCLIFILLEHTCIFLITFRRKSLKRISSDDKQHSILLPLKSFLYSCLHRNWIRAYSFSNMCLSIVYFVFLIFKQCHPTLVRPFSTTFYSLPLNLLKQLNINFSAFHLFIISISVLQYFLRYYRLFQNTYSRDFLNGRKLVLTKHTNVALILSSSLALIFAYNFVFYNPTDSLAISFLPLITLNMILLPLINLLILLFLVLCLMVNLFVPSNFDELSMVDDDEQENLRLTIERNTCIKCYSKILEKNPNLFQEQNSSYRNLYEHFFPIKRDSFWSNKPLDQLLNRRTFIQLNDQHSLCHRCYQLLFIFLFKYLLLTFPQHLIEMYLYSKHFHHFILKKDSPINFNDPLYKNYKYLVQTAHFLYLSSRFGDSLLFIRLSYLIKKYFPCWCQFNSKFLRQQHVAHQILTTKNSESSNNEPISPAEQNNANEQSIEHRRFRLRFQFLPLWSRNRPRLFRESV